MRKKEKERLEAIRLRGLGVTVPEIARRLQVSKSSVSTWTRDVDLSEAQLENIEENKRAKLRAQKAGSEAVREKFLKMRITFQEAGRERAREGSRLHMIGCMLYWAEGAKNRNRLGFVNSDPNMLLVWMRFLREELHVDDEIIKLQIHVHEESNILAAEQYWVRLLDLTPDALMKTQVKKGSNTRLNTLPYGVCAVNVQRTELAMHVYGAIQEYCGFENPDWLF
jgi:transcriptional regulator with XRE-family HTH domain